MRDIQIFRIGNRIKYTESSIDLRLLFASFFIKTYFYFLEVNMIPGFTSGSLVPKMWKKAGKSEGEFIEMLGF